MICYPNEKLNVIAQVSTQQSIHLVLQDNNFGR